MSEDYAEVKSGTSSVEVSLNAKGEPAFKVKVYAGTENGELDAIIEQAATALANLRQRVMSA